MKSRLNIVLITTDQHRGSCFGFEGCAVKTPHIDSMARSGLRFSTCMTPSPICQPARASILTGLYPKTHGVRDNGIDLDEQVGTGGFGGQLAQAGYMTGLIGKGHFSTYETFAATGRPENRLSEARYKYDWNGPYMGFQHVELLQHYDQWLDLDGHGAEKRRLMKEQLGPEVGAARTWHSALPVAWHQSTWTGNQAVRFIDTHAHHPFVLWASFADPHVPFNAPEPWSRMYDPESVELPPHRKLDLDHRPWWHRASLEGQPGIVDPAMRLTRETMSRLPPQSDLQLRHITANYWGMISLIDHNIGRILIRLQELGLMDKTIIVFTSDHGEYLGDHGLLLKGPMHYESLLRVACVFNGPGIPQGRIVEEPVSTMDLAATFLDFAGLATRPDMHGRSLRGLINGDGTHREFTYSEWELGVERCGVALDLATVRTKRHKLTIERQSGAGELYDLEVDPYEMVNIFNDPKAEGLTARLMALIQCRPNDAKNPPDPVVGMA